jgi:hypothetical protein
MCSIPDIPNIARDCSLPNQSGRLLIGTMAMLLDFIASFVYLATDKDSSLLPVGQRHT